MELIPLKIETTILSIKSGTKSHAPLQKLTPAPRQQFERLKYRTLSISSSLFPLRQFCIPQQKPVSITNQSMPLRSECDRHKKGSVESDTPTAGPTSRHIDRQQSLSLARAVPFFGPAVTDILPARRA